MYWIYIKNMAFKEDCHHNWHFPASAYRLAWPWHVISLTISKWSSTLELISYIVGPTLIVLSHLGSLLIIVTESWGAAFWAVLLYVIRMLATTGIYHRLLTHKSYQAQPQFYGLEASWLLQPGRWGPSWWKAHRGPSSISDQEKILIPLICLSRGLKVLVVSSWMAILPVFSLEASDVESNVVWRLFRLHFIPTVALGALSYYIGGAEYLGAFPSTVLFHGVATVNSLSHILGEQPFTTNDYSGNHWLVALGEGWHNLHHAFQSSARHGI